MTATSRGGNSATESRFYTAQRVLVCVSTAAVANFIGLAIRLYLYHGNSLFNANHRCVDFTTMWVSGTFAGSSNPELMYDDSAWLAAWKSLTGSGDCLLAQGHINYPPTLLFFTYPFGLMPYLAAAAAWIGATLLLYLLPVHAIIPRPVALIAAIASPAALKNFQLGYNGFLTAGLIGSSLVLLERRPWLSGVVLGVLTYKPQFGVLFPLALLVSRNWRALAGAMASGLIISIAAALVFGFRTWPAFMATLLNRTPGLSALAGVELRLESVYGLLYWAGAGARLAWAVHLLVALGTALAVCAVWARPIPHPLKAATLCIGSLLVSPYALVYDLCILSIAVAFLIQDGLARGFLAGERTLVLICVALLYCPVPPLGPVVYVVLLWLVFRRIVGVRGPETPSDRAAGIHKDFPETTAFVSD